MAGGGHHGDGGMAGMLMPPPSSPASSTSSMAPPGAPGHAQYMGGGGAMRMAFFWGKDAQILFSGWPGGSLGGYLLALFVVFALSFLVESLSYAARRLAFFPLQTRGGEGAAAQPAASGGALAAGLARTAVHAVRVGLAYVVMLAVMSFNVGVLLAAVAGHALGFLLLGSGIFAGAPTRTSVERCAGRRWPAGRRQTPRTKRGKKRTKKWDPAFGVGLVFLSCFVFSVSPVQR